MLKQKRIERLRDGRWEEVPFEKLEIGDIMRSPDEPFEPDKLWVVESVPTMNGCTAELPGWGVLGVNVRPYEDVVHMCPETTWGTKVNIGGSDDEKE